MAVPEQTPFIEYTANGTTTVYPLTFDCDKSEYLIVSLDGEEAPVGSWSLAGGSITFNTAPANGVLITIERNTPFRRTTEYQSYNNSFRPSPVNKDFDLIWWKLQELGVADWILGNRIDALKNYVDDRDDELRAYLMEEIRKQGVALDQLEEYYNYLMQRLAEIAVDKGWDASFVVDGDKTQKQINEEQNERKSVKLWSSGLADALGKFDAVDFDKDETVSAPVLLVSGQIVNSNGHELNQVTPTTIVLEGQYGASDIVIDGLSIQQDKSGVVSGGTNNNHAAIKIRGGLRNKIKNLVLDSQLGISLGMGEAGAADRRSMFNVIRDIVFKNTNIGVEHIGASYNQSMNIVVDPQDKGSFMGDRGTGYDKIENPDEIAHAPCHANNGVNWIIRNMATGISSQNSSKFESKINYFISGCDRAIQIIKGTVQGNNPTLNNYQIISEKCKQLIVNDGGNHNIFRFIADGSAFTDQGIQEIAGFLGKGFNQYLGTIKNSAKTAAQLRYSHNLYGLQVSKATGNGANVNGNYGGGLIIVDGATGTGVALAGNYNNLQVVATECLNALVVSGSGNTVNIQTDGNVQLSGSGNTIIGRIGGSLTVTGNDNKFIGEVAGTVTRTGTTGNDFTGLKGWSGNIVLSEQTTDGSGRVTVAVPKHTSAQIRNIYATIPTNTSEWSLKVISISGGNVMFELQDNSGNAVPSTAVAFNYTYSCS
ncbi:hypothetical protein HN258_04960 [Acinetobacter baumannii]|uniref:hypothetical protein n=1 Tax=Acinetobacter baumannii TaxID=470 RepID=UPI001898A44F|nr:hypothetical protein [Acinetobacter baumannii]MBF6687439.1 hypothetical protein [Acinetobacter baumannii]MBF6846193.1 hypothetical protein [Acinetobacter baumannii]MBF6916487.1 hypothetical protein [Acinetobacter baumannii]MBF6969282.1 hypothetical protein [Acinetobacter baumannii]